MKTNATVMLCQFSYVKLLLHPLFLDYIEGYLLVIHRLSCYDAHDKIVHVWGNKLGVCTLFISHTTLDPEICNEQKDVKPKSNFPSGSTSTFFSDSVFIFKLKVTMISSLALLCVTRHRHSDCH